MVGRSTRRQDGGCIFKVDTPEENEKKCTTTFKTLVMVARAFEETFVMVARVIEKTIIKWKVGWQERVVVTRVMTENEINAENGDKDVVMLKLNVVFPHVPCTFKTSRASVAQLVRVRDCESLCRLFDSV